MLFRSEPRNQEVVNIIGKYIDAGRNVVIWPEDINKKDINDIVKVYGIPTMLKLVINNVYSGLKAKMRYTYWKRV